MTETATKAFHDEFYKWLRIFLRDNSPWQKSASRDRCRHAPRPPRAGRVGCMGPDQTVGRACGAVSSGSWRRFCQICRPESRYRAVRPSSPPFEHRGLLPRADKGLALNTCGFKHGRELGSGHSIDLNTGGWGRPNYSRTSRRAGCIILPSKPMARWWRHRLPPERKISGRRTRRRRTRAGSW